MPERSVVGEHAVDRVSLEGRMGHPSGWFGLGGIRERAVAISLMRSLLVMMREIVL